MKKQNKYSLLNIQKTKDRKDISINRVGISNVGFPILKRPDEKWVTEKAYDNPKFVEDIARDVSCALQKLGILKQFKVKVENYESIHNHNAVCYIERYLKGNKWKKSNKSLKSL